MTYDEATPRERTISRALAAGMHVAFVLLLIFGVSWQKRVAEAPAVVELWKSLPPMPEEQAAPPPKIEPRPEPKPRPQPAPKPEVKPTPKPDIALKEKMEKERKLKERELEKQKQHELEKRKEDEAKKLKAKEQLELKKKEDEKRKLEKERLTQETDLKRLAAEKQALTDRLAKEQATAQTRALNEFVTRIQNKIRNNIIEPPGLQGNPQVEFEVVILPGGEIMDGSVKLKRSSGIPSYDQAVERAILKSSPLPVPAAGDPLFDLFRRPTLQIKPRP